MRAHDFERTRGVCAAACDGEYGGSKIRVEHEWRLRTESKNAEFVVIPHGPRRENCADDRKRHEYMCRTAPPLPRAEPPDDESDDKERDILCGRPGDDGKPEHGGADCERHQAGLFKVSEDEKGPGKKENDKKRVGVEIERKEGKRRVDREDDPRHNTYAARRSEEHTSELQLHVN